MRATNTFDDGILRELTANARISNAKLAQRVGLSESACLRRVQELERSGILLGYRARIDRKALGHDFVAYVAVGLATHDKETCDAFERAVGAARQVVECHNVTGSFEYLLRVEVADLESYKAFHATILGAAPGLSRITTYVVMSSSKDERA